MSKLTKQEKIDIENLENEERYFDLCSKYPKKINYSEIKDFDAEMETGDKFKKINYDIRNLAVYHDFNDLKYKLKKSTIFCLALTTSAFIEITGLLKLEQKKIYLDNKETIDSYDDELEKYASKFDSSKMSTLEIIMTVMNEIRSNTEYGFDYNEEELGNNFRVVLNDNNKVGVCRHMADKFTTIMNMIDERYEAQNLAVYLNQKTKNFIMCNIEQPASEEYQKELKNSKTEENETEDNDTKLANHMVTILKPIDCNYYLVVDVTNPSIGLLNNGKIYMFNYSENDDNSKNNDYIEYRPFNEYVMDPYSFVKINNEILLSYFQNINIKELNNLYGLENQNKILKKIK